MRWPLLLCFLAACDHRPAPAQDQAPPPSQAVPVGDDACLQIGVKVAEIIIAATTDPTQKAAYEQERTKLVKRFSDNCTRDAWSEEARRCFLTATTPAAIEECSRQLAKPAPAGSAAPVPVPGSAGTRPSTRD